MDTEDLIEMVGGAPLVITLLEGTQGTGIVLAETKKASESVINALKSLKATLLVQEFIKESEGKDVRCFVVDEKVSQAFNAKLNPVSFEQTFIKVAVVSRLSVPWMSEKWHLKQQKF